MRLDSSNKSGRFRDNLEECGDYGIFWSLLCAELHRCVRYLAMDGDFPTIILSPSFDTRYIFESYACFTEEWSVCLARGSCRGDERLLIDGAPLVSIDSDARIRPRIFYDRLKPISNHKLPEYS
ncbi:hypothetical protein YC2023_065872 [Brassica napus]